MTSIQNTLCGYFNRLLFAIGNTIDKGIYELYVVSGISAVN